MEAPQIGSKFCVVARCTPLPRCASPYSKKNLKRQLVAQGIPPKVAGEIVRIAYELDYRQFKYIAFTRAGEYAGSPDILPTKDQKVVLRNVNVPKVVDLENIIPSLEWVVPVYTFNSIIS